MQQTNNSVETFTTLENLMEHERNHPNLVAYVNERGISKKHRAILVDWLTDVVRSFKLTDRTLFLSINIVDFCISKGVIDSNDKIQLYGSTSLFIASKKHEIYAPELHDFIYIVDGAYTAEEVLRTELKIIELLNGNIDIPNIFEYARFTIKAIENTKNATSQPRQSKDSQTKNLDIYLFERIISKLCFYAATSNSYAYQSLPSVMATSACHLLRMFMLKVDDIPFADTLKKTVNPFSIPEGVIFEACKSIGKCIVRFSKSGLKVVTCDLQRIMDFGEYERLLKFCEYINAKIVPLTPFSESKEYLKRNMPLCSKLRHFSKHNYKKEKHLGEGTYGSVSVIKCEDGKYAWKKNIKVTRKRVCPHTIFESYRYFKICVILTL